MSACFDLLMFNGSRHLMLLTKVNSNACDTCMTTSGPNTFSIAPSGRCLIMLEDSNDASCSCWGAHKYLDWTVKENGDSSRTFGFRSYVNPDGVTVYGGIIYAETNGSACYQSRCWVDRSSGQPIPVNIYL